MLYNKYFLAHGWSCLEIYVRVDFGPNHVFSIVHVDTMYLNCSVAFSVYNRFVIDQNLITLWYGSVLYNRYHLAHWVVMLVC